LPVQFPSSGCRAEPSRDLVDEDIHELKSLAIQARFSLDFLELAAEKLGWDAVKQLVQTSQPKLPRTRRGAFGEILAIEGLIRFQGYAVPVKKFRFAVTGDQTLPGMDVVGLQLGEDDKLENVCFIECKLRTGHDTAAASQAYVQLRNDYESRAADILFYVAARLEEQGNPLLNTVLEYMRDRANTDLDILAIWLTWEQTNWSETTLANVNDEDLLPVPLQVTAIRLPELERLTDSVFTDIAIAPLIDDN